MYFTLVFINKAAIGHLLYFFVFRMLEDSDEKMCSLEDVEKIRLSRHKMEKYAFKIVEYMRKY